MEDTDESYGIHPAVADAGRANTDEGFQAAVDAELAAYWIAIARQASIAGPTIGRVDSLVGRDGQRLPIWSARELALRSRISGASPCTRSIPKMAREILPLLRTIAEAAAGTEYEASALRLIAEALDPLMKRLRINRHKQPWRQRWYARTIGRPQSRQVP